MLTRSHLERGPARPIPAHAGIGLRSLHHHELRERLPSVGWLEAHSENYFGDGGVALDALLALREHYPISLHGVGLSLGSTDPLDLAHLGKLERLVRRVQPALVSEHVSWSSAGGRHVNDLLPIPYTDEALRHLSGRVAQVQDRLRRPLLLENPSSYLRYVCSDLDEAEFLAALAAETGCALLLDINNVYVSAMNHGFDADAYLQKIPRDAVHEIHLAGHSVETLQGIPVRIDTHGSEVCDEVWSLYRRALLRFGALPTLIEWDTDIPPLDILLAEAAKANRLMEDDRARAA